MKQLYWKKVNTVQINNTVWQNIDFDRVQLETNQLENLFGSAVLEHQGEREGGVVVLTT